MKDEKRKGLWLPLNIQIFGEKDGSEEKGSEDNGSDNTDYKALYEKVKAEKDKASKEASDYKKQLREKQTDEEKKAQAEADRAKEIENIIKENKQLKLTTALAKDNVLTTDEITSLVTARYGDSDEDFATAILKVISAKLETQKTNLMNEFKRNPKLPNGSGGNGSGNDEITEMVKGIAKAKSGSQTKNFDTYFK